MLRVHHLHFLCVYFKGAESWLKIVPCLISPFFFPHFPPIFLLPQTPAFLWNARLSPRAFTLQTPATSETRPSPQTLHLGLPSSPRVSSPLRHLRLLIPLERPRRRLRLVGLPFSPQPSPRLRRYCAPRPPSLRRYCLYPGRPLEAGGRPAPAPLLRPRTIKCSLAAQKVPLSRTQRAITSILS